MTQIKISVTGSTAAAQVTGPVTCGMVGLPVVFSFDSQWDALTKTAVFRAGGLTKDRVGINGETTVPPEITKKKNCQLFVGVYGTNGDGSLVIPTVWAEACTIQPGAEPSADESTDPSLPVWQTALNSIGTLSDLRTKAKNDLVSAVNEVYDKDGTSGSIDDSGLYTDTAWSSLKTVEACCPAFAEIGSVVTCEPVEGYPLGAVSQILPAQEGSGDPSPENVRPIAGWSGAKLWRGGKNLLKDGWNDWSNYTAEGRFLFGLPPGRYSARCIYDKTETRYVYLEKSVDGGQTWTNQKVGVKGENGYLAPYINGLDAIPFDVTNDPNEKWCIWTRERDVPYIQSIQIEAGSSATDYEPYCGKEFTADFGEMRDGGGSYNWQTGELTIDSAMVTLTGQEMWAQSGTSVYTSGVIDDAEVDPYRRINGYCSHVPQDNGFLSDAYIIHAAGYGGIEFRGLIEKWGLAEATVDAMKAYLAEQYANGTPVQITYKLANPYTLRFDPQEILALSGVNTLYSDTGDTTVTGRTDPTAVIEKLTNAIIALGGNV